MLSLIIGTLNEFLVITGEYMNQKTASAPAAENKMGTMPIGKLLFNMSLPMMISMHSPLLSIAYRKYFVNPCNVLPPNAVLYV